MTTPGRPSVSSWRSSACRHRTGPAWIKAARSIGRNSPLRVRSKPVTMAEILSTERPLPPQSVTATGIGALRALLTSMTAEPGAAPPVACARTGNGAASSAAPPNDRGG